MLLKKSFCDHMLNFSCVLSPVTYRRYEGIARTTGNLAQTALRGTRTVSDCTSTSRKNSKKNCRCLVSDFFNSIDPKRSFPTLCNNVDCDRIRSALYCASHGDGGGRWGHRARTLKQVVTYRDKSALGALIFLVAIASLTATFFYFVRHL